MDGQTRKQRGLDQVSRNAQEFLETIRSHARMICLRQGYVTADDLRFLADEENIEPHHSGAWGGVFKQKGWRKDGRIVSKYPASHGREIYRWVWAGKAPTSSELPGIRKDGRRNGMHTVRTMAKEAAGADGVTSCPYEKTPHKTVWLDAFAGASQPSLPL